MSGTAPGQRTGAPNGVRTVRPAVAAATRLVLVRHGEAACNVGGVVGGPRGCTGLTEQGRRQAGALGTRLTETGELARAAALYTSVLARAVETAAIAAPGIGGREGGSPTVADCGLCELHPGDADGLTWDEFRARYGEPDFDAHPDAPVAPGGESWTSFVSRATDSLRRVADRHQGELVVVVCHAGVIEASLLRFLPVGGRTRLGLATEHTSLTEWERTEDGRSDGRSDDRVGSGTWRLLRYNDAAHLRPGAVRS